MTTSAPGSGGGTEPATGAAAAASTGNPSVQPPDTDPADLDPSDPIAPSAAWRMATRLIPPAGGGFVAARAAEKPTGPMDPDPDGSAAGGCCVDPDPDGSAGGCCVAHSSHTMVSSLGARGWPAAATAWGATASSGSTLPPRGPAAAAGPSAPEGPPSSEASAVVGTTGSHRGVAPVLESSICMTAISSRRMPEGGGGRAVTQTHAVFMEPGGPSQCWKKLVSGKFVSGINSSFKGVGFVHQHPTVPPPHPHLQVPRESPSHGSIHPPSLSGSSSKAQHASVLPTALR